MSHQKNTRHLRVVPAEKSDAEPAQMTLFPMAPARLAIFAPMAQISGHFFLQTLEQLQPRVLLDIRILPRFDFTGLNRSLAFEVFERHGLAYRDIFGALNVSSRQDARVNPALLAEELIRFLPSAVSGPVLFLTETAEIADEYAQVIPRRLHRQFSNWYVHVGWLPRSPVMDWWRRMVRGETR